ncbi:uncharacterized protein V1510DRAFT_377618 [Dipodascopsis tothii]|uniref:uncharacterized protein n=1 Tax=Dipodascopsis tothii TaxID=44089 RepID=UPI0034CEC052
MPRSIARPRILLLAFPFEYTGMFSEQQHNHFLSLEPILAQEKTYIASLVEHIVTLRPTLILSECGMSGYALDLFRAHSISVAYNVKPSVLHIIARSTLADIITSPDRLYSDAAAAAAAAAAPAPFLGTAQSFDIKTYRFDNLKKTFIFISGCPKLASCSVVLRGADMHTLGYIKTIAEFMSYVVYNLKLESCLLREEFAMIPRPLLAIEPAPAGDAAAAAAAAAAADAAADAPDAPPAPAGSVVGSAASVAGPDDSDSYLLDPISHQSITILYSLVCKATSAPCTGPGLVSIEFYRDGDCTLGQFIESICNLYDQPCSEGDGCTYPLSQHYRSYVHGTGRINVHVEPLPSRIPGMHNSILLWSRCNVCRATVPCAAMSDNTWKYSFGKYLELSFGKQSLSVRADVCAHDPHKNHTRFFGLHDMVVRFEYDSIDLLEIVVPGTKVVWKPAKDVSLRNDEYAVILEKINKFFDSVTSRLDSIKVDDLTSDRTDECRLRLDQLNRKASEERNELIRILQDIYMDTAETEYLPLNRAIRALQERVVQWDLEFADFDRVFFPSEKDIARLTAMQLKKMFVDDKDDPEVVANATLNAGKTASPSAEATAEETDLSSAVELMPVEKETAFVQRIASPISFRARALGISSPDFSPPTMSGFPSPGLSTSAGADAREPAAVHAHAREAAEATASASTLSTASTAATAASTASTASTAPTPAAKLTPRSDKLEPNVQAKAELFNRLEDEELTRQRVDKIRETRSLSPVKRHAAGSHKRVASSTTPTSSIAFQEPALAAKLKQPPSSALLRKRAAANSGVAIPPTMLIPDATSLKQRFPAGTTRELARQLQLSRSKPDSGPSSAGAGYGNGRSRVMSLARHFDQLSKEFEKERAKERAKLAVGRWRAVASSKPVAKVYRTIEDAVEEEEEDDDEYDDDDSYFAGREDDMYSDGDDYDGSVLSDGGSVAESSQAKRRLRNPRRRASSAQGSPEKDEPFAVGSPEDLSGSFDGAEAAKLPGPAEAAPAARVHSPAPGKDLQSYHQDLPPVPEKMSIMQLLSNFWADRSASGWKPLDYPLQPSEHIFIDSDIIVREDEPSSLIAFCLSSTDYLEKIEQIREADGTLAGERHATGYFDTETNLERWLLKETGTHLKYQFQEGQARLSCKIFYAELFDAFRRQCGCDDNYIQSLSRCVKWDSTGGKSGSAFLKTLDDRLVVKQLSPSELDAFVKFAPSYFQYMAQVFFHDLPSVIAKIMGFYQVQIRNPSTNKSMKMDILVMENLFYDHKLSRIFDLKGSMRNRHVEQTGRANEVLLDENMVEYIFESPLFVREHAKKILRASLWNDTLFLSKMNVMDYSLVIAIDPDRHQLVVGIIDCLRTFTWDKKLESWVKERGLVGGGGKVPTVVTPRQYKIRFREAMERYILMVPE